MSTIVRPSEAANLAVHACALMATAGGAALTTSHMAGAIGASEAHLSKVLQRLSHSRTRGREAGTAGSVSRWRCRRPRCPCSACTRRSKAR